MIALYLPIDNKDLASLSGADIQSAYFQQVNSIVLCEVVCPVCGKKGCLIFYGTYGRNLFWYSLNILLHIQRVRCKECGSTHALMPHIIVPYSRVPLVDQQEILQHFVEGTSPEEVLERNLLIDWDAAYRIYRNFTNFWEQRISDLNLSIWDDLFASCLDKYFMQPFQMRDRVNMLLRLPT